MQGDSQSDAPADDEIEILEVIGLDDDSPAARPAAPTERPARRAPDVVLDLDTGAAGAADRGPSALEQELREQLVRLSADFENFRKRVDRERETQERQASADLVLRLLPVLDNFERALSARRAGEGGEAGFADGVTLIFRQLLEELRREGLSVVDSLGEPFDPEIHEAVSTTLEPGLPPSVVVEELQRGYRLHGRLLRPALVRVTVDSPVRASATPADGERG